MIIIGRRSRRYEAGRPEAQERPKTRICSGPDMTVVCVFEVTGEKAGIEVEHGSRLSVQRSRPVDVVMIRNDGEKPTDEDAEKLLAEQYDGVESPLANIGIPEEDQAVEPGAKLTTVWGRVKNQ